MLPKKYKLKKDNDFKKLFKQGRYFQKDFIKLIILKNDLEISKFGFIVGTKISKKAIQRNKIKRQLEEIIYSRLDKIKSGFNIAVLVGPEIIKKEYQEIEKILINLLKKANLIIN